MADNTTLNAGTGGDVIATDDIAGVKYQRVKLSLGADGAAADAPIGAGTEAGVLRVTVANDSTGVIGVTSVVPGTDATNLGKAEDAAHSSADVGVMALAVRRDANTTLVDTTGDYAPIQVDANGNLKVAVITGGGSGGTSATDDAAFTAASGSGTPIMGFVTSDAVDSGDVGVVGMTAARAMKTVVTDSAGAVIDPQVDDAAFTAATSLVSVVGGFNTTDSVDSGDAGAFAMTATRALHTVQKVDTAGGTTIFRSLDIDETEEEIKATAGQVYWIHAMNLTAAPLYLKFYNATAANVTVGTTTPVLTFPLATQADTNGAGFALSIPNGIAFGTAITVACTTGVADNDTTGPAANGCVINVGYA